MNSVLSINGEMLVLDIKDILCAMSCFSTSPSRLAYFTYQTNLQPLLFCLDGFLSLLSNDQAIHW